MCVCSGYYHPAEGVRIAAGDGLERPRGVASQAVAALTRRRAGDGGEDEAGCRLGVRTGRGLYPMAPILSMQNERGHQPRGRGRAGRDEEEKV